MAISLQRTFLCTQSRLPKYSTDTIKAPVCGMYACKDNRWHSEILSFIRLPHTVRFIHRYLLSFNKEFISDVQNRSTLSVKRTLPCINWFLVSLPIKLYVSFTWGSLASTVEVARTSWVTTRCSCRVALVVMVVATVFSSTYTPHHHGTTHNTQHDTIDTDNTTQMLVTWGSKWRLVHDFLYWQSEDTVQSVVMTFVKITKPLQKILHNNYIFHDKFPYRQSRTFVHNLFLKTCQNVQKSSDRPMLWRGFCSHCLKITRKDNKQNSCCNK